MTKGSRERGIDDLTAFSSKAPPSRRAKSWALLMLIAYSLVLTLQVCYSWWHKEELQKYSSDIYVKATKLEQKVEMLEQKIKNDNLAHESELATEIARVRKETADAAAKVNLDHKSELATEIAGAVALEKKNTDKANELAAQYKAISDSFQNLKAPLKSVCENQAAYSETGLLDYGKITKLCEKFNAIGAR